MKKVIFATLFAVSSLFASAQIWVGGAIGLNINDPELKDAKSTTTLTFSPELGYSVNDKWDVAVSLGYNSESCDGNTKTNFSIEPYARYTFAQIDKVSFFVEGVIGFGSQKTKTQIGYSSRNDSDDYEEEEGEEEGEVEGEVEYAKTSQSTFSIGVRPGVKFAISDNFGLVTRLGFLGYKSVDKSHSEYGFNFSGNSLSLGMYWVF